MEKVFQLEVNDDKAKLFIYGDVVSEKWDESEVTALEVARQIENLDVPLEVHINSYGGKVSQGLAIYNLLKDYKQEVTTICDGFACSASSVIFMAGDKRVMHKSSLLMIHNAWTITSGDSNELRKQADDLEKITEPSIDIYTSVSNLPRDEIKKMLDEETWLTSSESLEYGFATEVIEDEAKQSLRDNIIEKLVMKTKMMNSIEPVKDDWFF